MSFIADFLAVAHALVMIYQMISLNVAVNSYDTFKIVLANARFVATAMDVRRCTRVELALVFRYLEFLEFRRQYP